MTIMNMPGFAAECALNSNHGRYLTRTCTIPNQQVIPQRINQACWIRAAIRTSIRCLNLGYSSELCAQTASDLADSVCDF